MIALNRCVASKLLLRLLQPPGRTLRVLAPAPGHKAEFNGVGGLRTYIRTRAGSLRHVYLEGGPSSSLSWGRFFWAVAIGVWAELGPSRHFKAVGL
jgi:hypothetical protein